MVSTVGPITRTAPGSIPGRSSGDSALALSSALRCGSLRVYRADDHIERKRHRSNAVPLFVNGYRTRLFVLKSGDALFVVGGEALFGVLALEEQRLQFAFERQCVLERQLGAGLDAALDVSHRHRCFIRRTELLSIIGDLLAKLLGGAFEKIVDHAPLEGLLVADGLSGRHHLDRARFAD